MKKLVIFLLIYSTSVFCAETALQQVLNTDTLLQEIMIQTAHFENPQDAQTTLKNLSLVCKKFNNVLNQEQSIKNLITSLGHNLAERKFRKNLRKKQEAQKVAQSEDLDDIIFDYHEALASYYQENKNDFDLKAAMMLPLKGAQDWFLKHNETPEDKQKLLTLMAEKKMLMPHIATLCNTCPAFNKEASLLDDTLVATIQKNFSQKPISEGYARILLSTKRALHKLYQDNTKITDCLKDCTDQEIALVKQAVRIVKTYNDPKRENGILSRELDNYYSNHKDSKPQNYKKINLLLRAFKKSIPQENYWLSSATDYNDLILGRIILEIFEPQQLFRENLWLNKVIKHGNTDFFELLTKHPEFSLHSYNYQKALSSAIENNQEKMFFDLLELPAFNQFSHEDCKQAMRKEILSDSLQSSNDTFFNRLIEHPNFQLDYSADEETLLQTAILKGKLEGAFKIIEKIKKSDPKALEYMQKFSYQELEKAYEEKIKNLPLFYIPTFYPQDYIPQNGCGCIIF